jgi:hypothetical protein
VKKGLYENMGLVKGLIIFITNITIFIIAIRFVSMLLERVGLFKSMERLFGKRDDEQAQHYQVNDYKVHDDDEEGD